MYFQQNTSLTSRKRIYIEYLQIHSAKHRSHLSNENLETAFASCTEIASKKYLSMKKKSNLFRQNCNPTIKSAPLYFHVLFPFIFLNVFSTKYTSDFFLADTIINFHVAFLYIISLCRQSTINKNELRLAQVNTY